MGILRRIFWGSSKASSKGSKASSGQASGSSSEASDIHMATVADPSIWTGKPLTGVPRPANPDYEKKRLDPFAKGRHKAMKAMDSVGFPLVSVSSVCPYCGGNLNRGKLGKRRSKFKAVCCGGTVYFDPVQRIYGSCYLTGRQQVSVQYLGYLDKAVDEAGTLADYWQAVESLGVSSAIDSDEPAVEAAVVYLHEYSSAHLELISPDSYKDASASLMKIARSHLSNRRKAMERELKSLR